MSHTYAACSKCHTVNKVDSNKALRNEAVCGKCGAQLELHGLVSHISESQFSKILKASDKPVVVDFWASWCGPCRSYGPEFEKASETTDAVFLKVNTEEEQHLSHQLGIRGIPTTIVFKNGKEVARQSGAMSSAQLSQFIQRS